MKVVIHAGIHRTGTTSLQGYLSDHRAILPTHGVIYPGDERNHQSLAWSLKQGRCNAADVEALIRTQGGKGTVVLSAEDFCIHTDLSWLKDLSCVHDVHVVFYLRRQDHWIMSWYNQHVKWPFDRLKSKMGKREFLDSIGDYHWLDYATLIERWTAMLGAGNVSAAVVEPGQVENVIEDFATRIGIPHEKLPADVSRKNDSMPVHLLEVARNLGLFDLAPKARIRLIQALRASLEHKAQSATTVYSPEERNLILKRFEQSNRSVAQRMFGRDSLFLEPSPRPDEPYFDFPKISQELLLQEWITPVVRELAERP